MPVVTQTVLLLLLSNVFMTLQEAITLSVFLPLAVLYLKEPVRLDFQGVIR